MPRKYRLETQRRRMREIEDLMFQGVLHHRIIDDISAKYGVARDTVRKDISALIPIMERAQEITRPRARKALAQRLDWLAARMLGRNTERGDYYAHAVLATKAKLEGLYAPTELVVEGSMAATVKATVDTETPAQLRDSFAKLAATAARALEESPPPHPKPPRK